MAFDAEASTQPRTEKDPDLLATGLYGSPGPDPITDRTDGLTSGQEPGANVPSDYLRHLDTNNIPKIKSADKNIIHNKPVTVPTDETPFPDNLTRALLELEAAYGYSPEDKILDKPWKEIIRGEK